MRACWPEPAVVTGFDSAGLDVTDERAVTEAVQRLRPAVVVNAAAYTAVDRAEDEPERAAAVNESGVRFLATAAQSVDALLVHVSTDYVFDGTKDGWYLESDPIEPLGVYGRTKAAGERAALDIGRSVVLRTAWVYGAHGPNFVASMLRLAKERREISVVADQVGCPTSAVDLANAIVELVRATGVGRAVPPHDLYHLAGPEAMSWYEFAKAVWAESKHGFDGTATPITTAEYPTRATRPANSRLDSSLITRDLGIVVRPFRDSLADVVAELESTEVPEPT